MNKEVFTFECKDCHHIFKARLGTKCPNCGSLDVRIIPLFKLIRYFLQ